MVTETTSEQHVTRLRFYAESSLNVSEELLEQIRHDQVTYEVHKFVDIRRTQPNVNEFELLVRWKGFDPVEDTWEELLPMYEQLPQAVIQFFKVDMESLSDESKEVAKSAAEMLRASGASELSSHLLGERGV